MNHQQTFDAVVAFARKQNAKAIAIHNRSCFYRENQQYPEKDLHGGKKCFVGAFIPDNMYSIDMENLAVDDLLKKFPLLINHLSIDGMDRYDIDEFWGAMQQIHDEQAVDDWNNAFRTYARNEGLNYVAPE